ncbi:MAG: 50S ribosomal protein L15 [Pseudomonadales bacterium]|nr:50S ribosomal protein L15 [Pseudomonadales bacterium]
MRLNDLSPAEGSKRNPRRVGRGIGSGLGKTGGKGVKGQTSRGKGKVRAGFEGGQMPIYRRLPKFGFTSLNSQVTAEVRLSELAKVDGSEITLATLKAANVVRKDMVRARVMLSGGISRPVTVRGLKVSQGARAAIVAAGGSVEE